jgi:ElaA protein
MIEWRKKSFEELTGQEVHCILALRQKVFVVEQRCAYLDADGRDQDSFHLSGWDEDGRLRAYLRIIPPGKRFPEPSIGRVVTDRAVRRQGFGKELMHQGIHWCRELYPNLPIRISAQQYLERFYSELGFRPDPLIPPYDDDGILHVDMTLPAGT